MRYIGDRRWSLLGLLELEYGQPDPDTRPDNFIKVTVQPLRRVETQLEPGQKRQKFRTDLCQVSYLDREVNLRRKSSYPRNEVKGSLGVRRKGTTGKNDFSPV